jgi:glucose uptake protein GlcU
VVGLGIACLVIGIILWITVMPAIGWLLMGIGVLLILVGLLIGAVWSLGRAADRRTY